MKRKNRNWKKYFLEFLMLFLAVFLGFLADSYREKLDEHAREKNYIESLISDIEIDRENVQYAIQSSKKRKKQLDSLSNLAFELDLKSKNHKDFYYYFLLTQREGFVVKPIDRTMIQLKSTGDMRLIRKESSLNEILNYEGKKEGLLSQSAIYEKYTRKLTDYGLKIFNTKKFNSFNPQNTLNQEEDSESFELITNEESVISEFGNLAFMSSSILNYYTRILEETDKEATKLLETLKKDYNLK